MKVLPDTLARSNTDVREKQFEHLGKAVFAADLEKVKARLKAEAEAREKANNGAKPRKRGRPKRNP